MANLQVTIKDLIAGAKQIDEFVCIRELREYVAGKFPTASKKQIDAIAWKLTKYVDPYLAGTHFIINVPTKANFTESAIEDFELQLQMAKIPFNWTVDTEYDYGDEDEMIIIEASKEYNFMEYEEQKKYADKVKKIIKRVFRVKTSQIDFDSYRQ